MKIFSNMVFALKYLIQVNQKRSECYRRVADRTDDIELKLLFMKYAIQSQGFNNQLNRWIIAYGSSPLYKENTLLDKAWSNFKSTFSMNDRKHLLGHCEAVERDCIKKYRAALGSSALVASVAIIDLQRQVDEMDEARAMMKELRESNIETLRVA